jgi:hypothetical protein
LTPDPTHSSLKSDEYIHVNANDAITHEFDLLATRVQGLGSIVESDTAIARSQFEDWVCGFEKIVDAPADLLIKIADHIERGLIRKLQDVLV